MLHLDTSKKSCNYSAIQCSWTTWPVIKVIRLFFVLVKSGVLRYRAKTRSTSLFNYLQTVLLITFMFAVWFTTDRSWDVHLVSEIQTKLICIIEMAVFMSSCLSFPIIYIWPASCGFTFSRTLCFNSSSSSRLIIKCPSHLIYDVTFSVLEWYLDAVLF